MSGIRTPASAPTEFERFLAEKQRRAKAARIGTFHTEVDNSSNHVVLALGNDWVHRHYGGDFLMSPPPESLPSVSLVFVQSRQGNTVTPNPAELGGGDSDLHLLYEGLTRVSADAVLAGSRTATGRTLFSVWHPELVSLRHDLGLPRHPAQIVVSLDGNLDTRALLFNVPNVPVFVIAGPKCLERSARLLDRPNVTVIPTDSANLTQPLLELRRHHAIERISAVGGRVTASSLIDAGLVQDVYLTTTLKSAGKPGTPFYAGTQQLKLELVLRKRLMSGRGEPAVKFEHFVLGSDPRLTPV